MCREERYPLQPPLLRVQGLLPGEEQLPQVDQGASPVELEAWQLVMDQAEWQVPVQGEFLLWVRSMAWAEALQ